MVEQQDVFYYVTLMNENYAQPDLCAGSETGIIRGCYEFNSWRRPEDGGPASETPKNGVPQVVLMGSGAILTETIKAARQLALQDISARVFSVTSWSELARDGAACQQRELRGDTTSTSTSTSTSTDTYIGELLRGTQGPIIAATDYVRAVPESIRAFLPEGRRYTTLGTDGFGRSDTRAALRDLFGVDAASIVNAALKALEKEIKPN